MATDRTLYDILGVPRDADATVVREAYRARAREHHPDVVGDGTRAGRDMAEINGAWRILSDPVSRKQYDLTLIGASATYGHGAGHADRSGPPTTSAPLPPARIPWRLLAVLAALGVGFVVVADATSSPPNPAKPDQLLASGSCVVIDALSAAVEVSCEGAHDAVVRQLVAFDRTCPADTEAHRDRQGMGLACLDMTSKGSGTGVQGDGGSG